MAWPPRRTIVIAKNSATMAKRMTASAMLRERRARTCSGVRATGTISGSDSGHHAVRRFCPVCGTHLFGNSTAFAQFTLVRTGTLDDPSSVRPQANIWVRRAPDWAVLDEKLPQWDGQPVASRPA